MSSFHFILLCFLCLFVAGLVAAQQGDVVTYERLRDSDREPQNWMHYWGNYQGTHYSALKQITKNNVANLQLQWSIQLPGASALETEPLVIDVWRWHSIPGPGEFGNDTWAGESWKYGAGPMWLTGSFDANLNTLYWTVGNPGAQVDRSTRGDGDNLFTDSVVALDPDTGQRKWHFQFTPNDGHDWDSTEDVVLVDRMWRGQNRKLLLHADRNGTFYVLDRTNGKFLSGMPFVYQNWNNGFDVSGRPIQVPGSNSSPEGSFFVYPSIGGATNFQAPSYGPITGWFYLALDAQTGTSLWRYQTSGNMRASPMSS